MPKSKARNEYDALIFQRKEDDAEKSVNHVKKKDKRIKGIEVVFDPAKHKDFITGFRKRKQQRRKEAQEQIKEKERQQRIASRAEKRSKLKEELGLGDNWGDSSSEDDPGQKQGTKAEGSEAKDAGTQPEHKSTHGQVMVYQQRGLMTTVTTMPIEDDIQGEQTHEQESTEGEANGDRAPKPHWSKGLKKGAAQGGNRGVQKKQHSLKSRKKGNRAGSGNKTTGKGSRGKKAKDKGTRQNLR